jgi:hypothetical protein
MGRRIDSRAILEDDTGKKEADFMTGHTGQKCEQSGIYDSNCHTKQIALSKGDTFPPCRTCQKSVTWTLSQATK